MSYEELPKILFENNVQGGFEMTWRDGAKKYYSCRLPSFHPSFKTGTAIVAKVKLFTGPLLFMVKINLTSQSRVMGADCRSVLIGRPRTIWGLIHGGF